MLSTPPSPTPSTSSAGRFLRPIHPTKKKRSPKTLKDNALVDSCLKASQGLHEPEHEKGRPKNASFGEYVAFEMDKLDLDLQTELKNKISNLSYEMNDIQLKRK